MFSTARTLPFALGLSLWLGGNATLAAGCSKGQSAQDAPPGLEIVQKPGSENVATRENATRSNAVPANPALPGIPVADAKLTKQLGRSLANKGPNYKPRTHHLLDDGGPKYTNRLIFETSPYLLQHAHNPVNWFPWGDEAFARAKAEDKPVFLSVGYSTCHWCHVMERESFENDEIAAYLNEHFIAIKVDREVRPDVDSVYMTSVHLLAGRGGWPMTVVMTPDKEPFFAGTYFPPRTGARGARQGLLEILKQLAGRFRDDRATVVEQARTLSRRVQQSAMRVPGARLPSPEVFSRAAQALSRSYDATDGGFGRAPKFPQPARLSFLLRYARRTGDPTAKSIVTHTLTKMSDGGMYDHVGGGFHRYATDARWLVPHFEKMLYDNAQLAELYVAAWQVTGNDEHQRVAREILDYVAREMTAPRGGFYSAADADSKTPDGHDEEGWFFTWTPTEVRRVLGPGAALFEAAYGITDRGNFEGRNIAFRAKTERQLSKAFSMSVHEVRKRLKGARDKLYQERSKRPPPLRDDKVISAWNGLMISAFARASLAFNEPQYGELASNAANLILTNFVDNNGLLFRTRMVEPRLSEGTVAFLDDYAAMVGALLDLYELTSDERRLAQALALQQTQDDQHLDATHGGYFMTSHRHEALLAREKPLYDGAVPSGNALSAMNLVRLAEFTGDATFTQRAEALFGFFSNTLERSPTGSLQMLGALDYYYDVPMEIAVVAPDGVSAEPLFQTLRKRWLPNRVLVSIEQSAVERQSARVPWLKGKAPLRGKPTAYVCERGSCELPTSNPQTFARQIGRVHPYPGAAPARLAPQ